jgi:oligopeptide transport system substrate-binding protein
MLNLKPLHIRLGLALCALALCAAACSTDGKPATYFGRNTPPTGEVLRYVTGDEPESLDPQVSTGQPEGRIYMALYEGLTVYGPKDMQPIPGVAERWDVNRDSTEFTFHLRQNARWSNGEALTAQDFVYSLRRGLSPDTASRFAFLAYYVKYAQPYNEGAVFARDAQTGQFLLKQDFEPEAAQKEAAPAAAPAGLSVEVSKATEQKATDEAPAQVAETAFHQYMHAPDRLTLPGDEKERAKVVAKDAKLQAALAGKEFVAVAQEDVGIEAVDDYTLRFTLVQPAAFFVGLTANQFFSPVPRKAIEQYGAQWAQPGHIVTCGPFKLSSWSPYDQLVVERDPMYWDAAAVHLDKIYFYPMNDNPQTMNLYKVGDVDAVPNHTVPAAWLDLVMTKRDYMNAPEAAIIYININTTKPPMDDVRVRKAFNMAIDKAAWIQYRKIVKPLGGFVPEGIFPGYPKIQADSFDAEKARRLLADAGFPVVKKSDGSYECAAFPVDKIEYSYPTQDANRVLAEFMQAQWKQNLGITVPLKNMEWKTYQTYRASLEYKGMTFGAYSADYMDPFTFLSLFYIGGGENGTGWKDQKYVSLLDAANQETDQQQRFALLAKAEKYLIDDQPVIPLNTGAVNWMKKPYVKGMYPNPGSMFSWKFVYLERNQSNWDNGTPKLN